MPNSSSERSKIGSGPLRTTTYTTRSTSLNSSSSSSPLAWEIQNLKEHLGPIPYLRGLHQLHGEDLQQLHQMLRRLHGENLQHLHLQQLTLALDLDVLNLVLDDGLRQLLKKNLSRENRFRDSDSRHRWASISALQLAHATAKGATTMDLQTDNHHFSSNFHKTDISKHINNNLQIINIILQILACKDPRP